MINELLFTNARVLDVTAGQILENRQVSVKNGLIHAISDHDLPAGATQVFDLAGKTLMPGLCDAHVHVTSIIPDFALLKKLSPSYVAVRAGEMLTNMLMRGFTTVRDAGGADFGLADAVEEGVITGPRLRFSGHALSQTGGHGDFRARGEQALDDCYCAAGLGRICDGITEVRRATRDEIRNGAHQIKVMASGGIVSPTDRITSTQFSVEELSAIVEEAQAANIYVMAHAYTARAINRALECGVRSIEHGNLLDQSSIDLFLQKSAFLVPTLATYHVSYKHGLAAGLPKAAHDKIAEVLDAGIKALELAHKNGVKIVYGTDLLGSMQNQQLEEFSLRSQVQAPIDIIRSATIYAAELFQMKGEIGEIIPGARADLLVVDGNPLQDISVLQDPDRHLKLIAKDGRVLKNAL